MERFSCSVTRRDFVVCCCRRLLLFVWTLGPLISLSTGHFLPSAVHAVEKHRYLDETLERRLCRNLPGLTSAQRGWCRTHLPFVGPIAQGAALGLKECERQFEFERWNCSFNGSTANFEYMMSTGSREAAFVSSIQAAGVTLAIARTCSAGNVTEFCSCDTSVHDDNTEHNINGKFDWGGCGDNFEKGYQFSKEFLDSAHTISNNAERNQTGTDLMELHNNEAGRVVVQSTLQTICKCHGLTGACSVKICWRSLPKVQVVGFILKDKYRNAMQMAVTEAPKLLPRSTGSDQETLSLRQQLMPLSTHGDSPSNSELAFLRRSPDYCRANETVGILGIAGRECKPESRGDDGCELLCCGNGAYPRRSVLRQKCECEFIFCCDVVCESCLVAWETYHCHAPLRPATR